MMDDVKMSNLISEEDILKELETFNINVLETSGINKMKNICLVYDFTAEKIVSEWLGFCSKKSFSTCIDLPKLELFENEGFRKQKIILENSSKETKFKSDKSMDIDNEIMNDYNFNESFLPNKTSQEVILNVQNLNPEPKVENCVLENKLNETIESVSDYTIESNFGELLDFQNWFSKNPENYKIKPLDSELHITKPYKTNQIRIHLSNQILNEAIEEMSENFNNKLNVTKTDQEELEDKVFIGRIILELSKSNEKIIFFESTKYIKKKFKLDLTGLHNYSLFPGKIVCFKGLINNDTLIVKEFIENQSLIPNFYNEQIKLHDDLFIMTACGPVSPNNTDDLSNLEKFLEQVKIFKPNYVIIMGPFLDCRNDYLLFNCDGEVFFNKIIKLISIFLENIPTEAIIIPSTFDLNSYNQFPAPPFEHSYPKIHFMPNPSFLNINGVILALTSVDIVRHILREEIRKSNTNEINRINQVCEHLLIQNSLYPLYPPNQEINLEYSKLDFIKLNVKPHLFILPSMIKNFIKSVHESIFINPECLSKGFFSKIKISKPSSENYTGSIEKLTSVEISKLKN